LRLYAAARQGAQSPSGSATSTSDLAETHALPYQLRHFFESVQKYTHADKAALRQARRLIHKPRHLHRQHNFQQPL